MLKFNVYRYVTYVGYTMHCTETLAESVTVITTSFFLERQPREKMLKR